MAKNHEADLEWFLGKGETVFARSPTGTQLDKCRDMSPSPVYDTQNKRMPDKYDRRKPSPPTLECPEFDVARGADLSVITAQPTCEVRGEGRVEPDDKDLMRYASVSSRLAKVGRLDLNAVTTLELYYGDTGACWGRTKHGRIFSLYAVTTSGQALVERVEREDEGIDFLPALGRLAVIAALQGIPRKSKAWRKQALHQADKQAWVLYRSAVRCWLEVG